MNNERYNQIIDEAYSIYISEVIDIIDGYRSGDIIGIQPHIEIMFRNPEELIPLNQQEFIDQCKNDSEFSERWGLKIEERELSLGERGELFRKEYPNKSVDDFAPGGMEVQSLNHQLNTRYNNANIPTKLITITYNNETIEVYE
jgi:hypothetical protein